MGEKLTNEHYRHCTKMFFFFFYQPTLNLNWLPIKIENKIKIAHSTGVVFFFFLLRILITICYKTWLAIAVLNQFWEKLRKRVGLVTS